MQWTMAMRKSLKMKDNMMEHTVYAVINTENKAPINETLKTGPDNVNENGKGHGAKTMVLDKKRNTRRRSNKVTAKTPLNQLNQAMSNKHVKSLTLKSNMTGHVVMDTENESLINETLKTGQDNVNKNGKGYEVKTVELNKKKTPK